MAINLHTIGPGRNGVQRLARTASTYLIIETLSADNKCFITRRIVADHSAYTSVNGSNRFVHVDTISS